MAACLHFRELSMDGEKIIKAEVMVDEEEDEVEVVITGSGVPTPPRPMQGLNEIGAPPFLTKTYEMVEDQATDDVVSWSRARNSFIVWDSNRFSTTLLPKYFKHSNFSSFIRQLNTYGFRKVDPDRWEFANEGFLGGQKHLLKIIKRRRHVAQQQQQHQGGSSSACVEVGQFGLDGMLERLKRDCSVLTNENVRLKQQQQESREYILAIQNRLQATERKQQQIMGFLAKALNNPSFIQQFMLESAERKALEGASVKRKRRLTGVETFQSQIDNMDDLVGPGKQPQDELVNMESEIDNLLAAGLESKSSNDVKSPNKAGGSNVDSLNEVLWDQLLNGDLAIEEEQFVPGDIPDIDEELRGQNSSDWGEDFEDLVDQLTEHDFKP